MTAAIAHAVLAELKLGQLGEVEARSYVRLGGRPLAVRRAELQLGQLARVGSFRAANRTVQRQQQEQSH